MIVLLAHALAAPVPLDTRFNADRLDAPGTDAVCFGTVSADRCPPFGTSAPNAAMFAA